MVWGFLLGFLVEFLLNRICDAISKRHARTVNYNCDDCQFHCTGYHCWTMRPEIADYHRQGDTDDEVHIVSGEDSDRDAAEGDDASVADCAAAQPKSFCYI